MADPSLQTVQHLLWTLIRAPEGAAAGLTALPPAERGLTEHLVREHGGLTATERIDIYANMYFFRIRDCLKTDFAAVLAVLGEAGFHNLITDYLLAHPPSHFSLRFAGQHLPAFLTRHAFSERQPYLADLAALEWAIIEAFDAADATPVNAQSLAEVPQPAWPALRLGLVPSVQLLMLRWPVLEVWRRCDAGEPVAEIEPRETPVRVWRQDLRVFHRAVDAAEMAALRAVAGGAPFAEVCARIAEQVDDAASAERAAELLAQWVADGLLTRGA
jgi:hypothetical protein